MQPSFLLIRLYYLYKITNSNIDTHKKLTSAYAHQSLNIGDQIYIVQSNIIYV